MHKQEQKQKKKVGIKRKPEMEMYTFWRNWLELKPQMSFLNPIHKPWQGAQFQEILPFPYSFAFHVTISSKPLWSLFICPKIRISRLLSNLIRATCPDFDSWSVSFSNIHYLNIVGNLGTAELLNIFSIFCHKLSIRDLREIFYLNFFMRTKNFLCLEVHFYFKKYLFLSSFLFNIIFIC